MINLIKKFNIISWLFLFCSQLYIYILPLGATSCILNLLPAPAISNFNFIFERKMEFSEHGFLEELLALRRDAYTWDTSIPAEMNQIFSDGNWIYDCFDENPAAFSPNSFSAPIHQQDHFNYNNFFNEAAYCPYGDDQLSAPQLTDSSSMNTLDSHTHTPPSFPIQEEAPLSMMELDGEEPNNLLADEFQNLEMLQNCFKVEPVHESPETLPVFNMGTDCLERKSRNKKLGGQPSKNLMAERRRRKRLNDRLSMLRSIVPKISKVNNVFNELYSIVDCVLVNFSFSRKWFN